jgi:hypothetical protein
MKNEEQSNMVRSIKDKISLLAGMHGQHPCPDKAYFI